jgi:hypothetical protein
MSRLLRSFIVLSIIFLIAACGGGGVQTPIPSSEPTENNPVIPIASGKLSVEGDSSPSFTPNADGFEVYVTPGYTSYIFRRGSFTGTDTRTWVEVTTPVEGTATVRYSSFYTNGTFVESSCQLNCALNITTPNGASHPVTIEFNQSALKPFHPFETATVTLSGSVTGDVENALWSPLDLPKSVALSGSDTLGALRSTSTGTTLFVNSLVFSSNDLRGVTFLADPFAANGRYLDLVRVISRNGVIVDTFVDLFSSDLVTNEYYECRENKRTPETASCSGITLSADGRRVTFNNARLTNSHNPRAAAEILNGTLRQ